MTPRLRQLIAAQFSVTGSPQRTHIPPFHRSPLGKQQRGHQRRPTHSSAGPLQRHDSSADHQMAAEPGICRA
eukprot:748399-Pyramimonas_sp.AAC.1